MERRFILFLVLSVAIMFGYSALMQHQRQQQARQQKAKQAAADRQDDKGDNKEQPPEKKPEADKQDDDEKPAEKQDVEQPKKDPQAVMRPALEPEPEHPERWVTLGSFDPKQPFRMLVTLTTKGAALARVELNDPRYCNIDKRYGYLGYLASNCDTESNGCRVRFVGEGTPAAEAGLLPGDILKRIDEHAVSGPNSLQAVLKETKPRQEVKLSILRDGKPLELTAKLRRVPLDVVSPEADDPLSMLMTLSRFDDRRLDKQLEDEADDKDKKAGKKAIRPRAKKITRELDGIDLRTAHWKYVEAESDITKAVFILRAPKLGLEFIKTYRLAEVPEESLPDKNYPAYHLFFDIEIRNIGDQSHEVAYQLDGPNGLPQEGKWYAYRVSRNWGGAGLRDFIVAFKGSDPTMVSASNVAVGDVPSPWSDNNLQFIGVDAQYFSAVLMPDREKEGDSWYESLEPICVGQVDPQNKKWANTSCRLTSVVTELSPGGPSLKHTLKLFAGPKRPALLENDKEYNLGELVYYGWPIFAAVAVPLTKLLHILHSVTFNYGLAIILLTVIVRACMFPLSRKQVLGAQKMQQLQPEIKKIQQKYKNNTEARTKAQQELFKKHNYNPLAGCLPIFIQLPIFIGLYRALMVDIELRDAPLITHAVRWCSNLAAPDMLYDWSGFMPEWFVSGQGMFALGPYFNILPILTIFLFIAQQKMFMPPAADDQAAMQQKIMKYMMVFMGLLFFKVASGLCLYFIASSLWGVTERQFLPKPAAPAPTTETRAEAKARQRQEAEAAKKKKK